MRIKKGHLVETLQDPKVLMRICQLDDFFPIPGHWDKVRRVFSDLIGGGMAYVVSKTYEEAAFNEWTEREGGYEFELNLNSASGYFIYGKDVITYSASHDYIIMCYNCRTGRGDLGMTGCLHLEMKTGKLHVPQISQSSSEASLVLLRYLAVLIHMGTADQESVDIKPGGVGSIGGTRLKNRSGLQITLVNAAFHKEYHFPEKEVGPYERWQWYGPRENRYKKKITVGPYRRGPYTRTGHGKRHKD